MRFSIYALGLLIPVTFTPSLAAVEKPEVGLTFAVEEPAYLKYHLIDPRDGSDKPRKKAEKNFLVELQNRLAMEFGFLRFRNGPASYRLDIALGHPDASLTQNHSVNLRFTLSGTLDGKSEEASVAKTCLFRDAGGTWADGLGGADGLVKELLLRFNENRCRKEIRSLFGSIPVSRQGTTVHHLSYDYPIVWFLPFSDSDFCLGPGSRVRFLTETDTGTFLEPSPLPGYFAVTKVLSPKTQVPLVHQVHIACVPESGQNLRLAQQYPADKVKVKWVFVASYARMPTGCEIPKPSQVAKGTRGGL